MFRAIKLLIYETLPVHLEMAQLLVTPSCDMIIYSLFRMALLCRCIISVAFHTSHILHFMSILCKMDYMHLALKAVQTNKEVYSKDIQKHEARNMQRKVANYGF